VTRHATVIIPTHDHGALLSRSVASACAQTVGDIEIVVIGDGVPEEARDAVNEAIALDPRIRFVDHPKGPRLGEAYRHRVLGDATGEIVCYLCDDDLWLPHHIEVMEGLLSAVDVAHVLPLWVTPDGTIETWPGDLGDPRYRQQLLDGLNFIPLSCFGHTMGAYRRLPEGWRTTPESIPTDLYMYQQFLAQPWCRASSGWEPTVLHFPASDRRTWSDRQVGDELDRFSSRLHDPQWQRRHYADCIAAEGQPRAWLHKYADEQRVDMERITGELQALASLEHRRGAINAEFARLQAENADLRRGRHRAVDPASRPAGHRPVRPLLGRLIRRAGRTP
jgi:glycosyltransferase involved in cell wall biosynthesis